MEEEKQVKISRFSVIREIFSFMKAYKKYWLIPMVVVLLLFGLLMVFAQGSAFAPFIYVLF